MCIRDSRYLGRLLLLTVFSQGSLFEAANRLTWRSEIPVNSATSDVLNIASILSPYFRPAIIGHRRPSPQDRHSRRFRLFKVSVCAVIPLQLHAAVMQAVQRRVVGGANPSACQILHVGGVCRRVVLPYFIMASRVAVAFARYRRVRQPAHTSISVISHVGSPSSWCRHQPGHTAG